MKNRTAVEGFGSAQPLRRFQLSTLNPQHFPLVVPPSRGGAASDSDHSFVPHTLRGILSLLLVLVALVVAGCARDPYRTDFTLSDNHGNSIRYSGPKDVHVGNVTSSTKTKSMEASLTISDYTANTSTNAISAYVEHAKVVSQGIIDGINAAANAAGTLGAAAAKKTVAPAP